MINRQDLSPPLRDARPPLSSAVRHIACAIPLIISAAAIASGLNPLGNASDPVRITVPEHLTAPARPAFVASPSDPAISDALARWDALRRDDSFDFQSYAGFMIAHPGWPGEARMRRLAEAKADQGHAVPRLVADYFTRFPPQGAAGRARYAEALARLGRSDEARTAARLAWASGTMPAADEARLMSRFAANLTPLDHDRRMEKLLAQRATAAATRLLLSVTAGRRPLYDARLALQAKRDDAGAMLETLGPAALADPGLLLDKARWLVETGQPDQARALLAQPVTLSGRPVDPALWVDTLLDYSKAAATAGQPALAYGIARNATQGFAPETDISAEAFALRDDYTSLVWIGAQAALRGLGQPLDAMALFDRYARAARTPQTQTKGWYWAARAALAGGDKPRADAYLAAAAVFPDQFYGQLAAERLGKASLPAALVSHPAPDPIRRALFEKRELVRAARLLGTRGIWGDQSLFLRALAQQVEDEDDQALAAELARAIGRPDLGVMVARNRRTKGGPELIRSGFPALEISFPDPRLWTMVHAIARQESQFDRQIVSHAGATGLMQLMPGTAQDTATRLGLPYDRARLGTDASYNVLLGSTFFARLLQSFDGNHVLAIAAYNAGPGNVRKWLVSNGDPRQPGVDVVDWIEAIPFSETRGYVQRVLENAVIYDALNPAGATMPGANRLSAYLGKPFPG